MATDDRGIRPESGDIPPESLERQHEQRDFGLGIMFTTLVGIIVLMVLAAGGMVVFQNWAGERARAADPPPSPMIEDQESPPSPRLETTPGEVLRELRRLERVQLGGYGWVDPEAGIARIPVERAMEIIAERDGELPPVAASEAGSGEEESQ